MSPEGGPSNVDGKSRAVPSNIQDPKVVAKAEQEQAAVADKSLDDDHKRNRALRYEGFQKHLFRLLIIGLYLVIGMGMIAFFIWVLHLLTPMSCRIVFVSCHWLTQEQLGKVEGIIFSGGLGAIASSLGRYLWSAPPASSP